MHLLKERDAVIGIDASRATSRRPTGTEAYSYHLIRHLVPRLRPEHLVRLYFRQPPEEVGAADLVTDGEAEARAISFPRLWTHGRLSWEMVRHPPDLLFVPSHVLPIVRPQRTLVTVHDVGYRFFPEAHPPGQRRYLEISTRWNVRMASHVLADSFATRDAIVEAYGTPPERITVVYPGYSRDLQPVDDPAALADVRRRYGISGAYILFIGRIQPRKNLARLIEAFGGLAFSDPDLTLVLAGPTGWLSAPIEAKVRELGLGKRVRFPGYVAAEDKAALISGAEIFAYPSLYEGFGFPVLEAQACGTPLLTSTTSSLPEVAGDGAILVDPHSVDAIAEGLTRLRNTPELRRHLIDHGYANLSRFAWSETADRVRDVIARLLT